MRCFVTGANGFIGVNLVRELVEQGHQVTGLVRPQSDRRGLEGVECELVEGDLERTNEWSRALRGSEWIFHAGASYSLWLPDYAPMYRANVEGTREVLRAAHRAGCLRVVYTSTVGCIGLPRCSGGKVIPSDEETPVDESQMRNDYKRSKWQAEQTALELARTGVPVVIVNPSAPVGPHDYKPTPTGQVIADFLGRKMPAYVDTGLNWVHVRDVARGHVLAAERGRVGERYILGNAKGNWTLRETLEALEAWTGIPAPKVRVPHWVALAAAYFDEAKAKWTGRSPRAPLAGVRMAKYKMFFNPEKAIRELEMPQTPVEEALQDAVRCFSK